jgi:hypothetical protein
MSDVFISYSQNDRDFVHRLASDLEEAGISVYFNYPIKPGDSWQKTISDAIEGARWMLLVLSPDYLVSQWSRAEWIEGLSREFEKKMRVVPLLARECSLDGILSTKVKVDFTKNYEYALRSLVAFLRESVPSSDIETGTEPGDLTHDIELTELAKLSAELKEAVAFFKSTPSPGKYIDEVRIRPSADRLRCFIVMPFSDPDLEVVYEDFVRPVIENECEFDCERGDDVFGSNVIMDDIRKSINNADIVVADLTGKNANVFYEVGICHAIGRPVLLMAQSIDDIPFDLRHYRILLYEYSPRGCKKLEKSLRDNLLAMIENN